MSRDRPDEDGSRAFEFLLGDSTIVNRRLVHRFAGSDEWETFEARQTNLALPGNIGNYDDFVAHAWRPGYVGLSLRLFNPQNGLWSIYWLDNETGGLNPSGLLRPPVVGKFTDGVGVFEGSDEIHGKPILVRFTWADIDTSSPRWEQSMSDDDGQSWEMNWSMVFDRR
jgi:hypothetical protein